MSRGKFAAVALTLALAAATTVRAREGNTLQDELRIFTEESAVQCTSVKEQLANFKVRSDPLTGFNLQDAVQSLCVCLPAKTQALKDGLSPEQLARPVTEQEFLEVFNPAVANKCAAEQMRSMYGDRCPTRFRKPGLKMSRYCECMKGAVGGYSEEKAAAIAAAASEFLPLAADAEKKGEAAPSRPAVLEDYYQDDQRCKVK